MEWIFLIVFAIVAAVGGTISSWKDKDFKNKAYETCLNKKDTNCKELLKQEEIMGKTNHMNTIKHKAPPEGRSKHRSSGRNDTKQVNLRCECGNVKTVTVLTSHPGVFGYKCNKCAETERIINGERKAQEKIFGKGKNFLTALEGL